MLTKLLYWNSVISLPASLWDLCFLQLGKDTTVQFILEQNDSSDVRVEHVWLSSEL